MTTYPRSRDGAAPGAPPASLHHQRWRFIEQHLPNLSFTLLILTLFAAILYPHCVVTVPSGEVGVLWKRFDGGTVLDPKRLRDEGIHFILPWDELFLYDLRLQSIGGSYNAISRDGVSLVVSINFRFQLNHNAAPQLHQAIGPDYVKLLVGPEIGSRLREVIAEYAAEEVYSSRRQHIQEEIRRRTVEKLGEKLVQRQKSPILELYDTLVLGIELPPEVRDAINRKIEQFYIAEEYTYRVIREEKESERKRIEAAGIRDFQRTVSQGISESYLRWRGIEATLQLAQSTNSKVVVIGSGRDGLPIILGNVDGPPPAPAAPRSPLQGPTPAPGSTPAPGPTTAPGPTRPVDKPPLGGLSTPAEKPPAPSGSPTTPAEPPFSSPLSWAGIKALLSWVFPGKGTKTEPGATPSIAEQP